MSHIRKFDNFRKNKTISKKNEMVELVDDNFKVHTITDIPKNVINSYVKKVKDETGKDLRNTYGDKIIAEELVKYVLLKGLISENIPSNALVGGQSQGQGQGQNQNQPQKQAQPQVTVQNTPQAQAPTPQSNPETQTHNDSESEFEDIE